MSKRKKTLRRNFRKSVLKRDKFRCLICGTKDENLLQKGEELDYYSELLDVHHITNRKEMPNGGFVKENGISLCKNKCHKLAEQYLQNEIENFEFSPENLYELINSNYDKALEASKRLK